MTYDAGVGASETEGAAFKGAAAADDEGQDVEEVSDSPPEDDSTSIKVPAGASFDSTAAADDQGEEVKEEGEASANELASPHQTQTAAAASDADQQSKTATPSELTQAHDDDDVASEHAAPSQAEEAKPVTDSGMPSASSAAAKLPADAADDSVPEASQVQKVVLHVSATSCQLWHAMQTILSGHALRCRMWSCLS